VIAGLPCVVSLLSCWSIDQLDPVHCVESNARPDVVDVCTSPTPWPFEGRYVSATSTAAVAPSRIVCKPQLVPSNLAPATVLLVVTPRKMTAGVATLPELELLDELDELALEELEALDELDAEELALEELALEELALDDDELAPVVALPPAPELDALEDDDDATDPPAPPEPALALLEELGVPPVPRLPPAPPFPELDALPELEALVSPAQPLLLADDELEPPGLVLDDEHALAAAATIASRTGERGRPTSWARRIPRRYTSAPGGTIVVRLDHREESAPRAPPPRGPERDRHRADPRAGFAHRPLRVAGDPAAAPAGCVRRGLRARAGRRRA
jgi:hypothetical protein